MKELTIEQKAIAYDEAIERAKKWYNAPNSDKMPTYANRVIEEIFPELRESEDEKVRKTLIRVLNENVGNGIEKYGAKLEDALAWLEKQGDKDKLIQELGEYKVKYTQEVLNEYLNINNKDNERLRKTTIDFLKEFADKGYENAIECIDWLEKQGNQNHIEQDLEMVEALRTEYEKGKADAIAEMQQEWGEEDEKILKEIISDVKFEGYNNDMQTNSYKKINWLKFLKERYLWKPSDEQMEALYEETQKSDRIKDDRIVSLYNDLKKLKEQ